MIRYAVFILFIYCLFIMQGCMPAAVMDTESRAYVPITGWSLVLHQDVTVAAGRSRVYFQDGELQHAINEFKPHCQLKVRSPSEKPQTILADLFIVTRVVGSEDEIVTSGRILLASAGADRIARSGGLDSDTGPLRLMHVYHMQLHSDKQPDVTYFSCAGAMDDPAYATDPTLQDIRASIGDYATFGPSDRL